VFFSNKESGVHPLDAEAGGKPSILNKQTDFSTISQNDTILCGAHLQGAMVNFHDLVRRG
jgi:hypothetical protein